MQDSILPGNLTKRERQVMEIILRLKQATGRDIERELPDAPTYSAIRSILRILVNKGLLAKRRDGDRDWYSTTVSPAAAKSTLVRSFVRNFFGNSAAEAACALLGQKGTKLSDKDAAKLIQLIEEARKK